MNGDGPHAIIRRVYNVKVLVIILIYRLHIFLATFSHLKTDMEVCCLNRCNQAPTFPIIGYPSVKIQNLIATDLHVGPTYKS